MHRQITFALAAVTGCQPSSVATSAPAPSCSSQDALARFEPSIGPGYVDIPMNGETEANQTRSYLRCDLQALIKEAAASVATASFGWPESNGMPLVLGDMSLSDGSVPLLSDGVTPHTGGTDLDVGYFQTADVADNQLRAVCDTVADGQDEYHCTAEPRTLDVRRTALFVSLLSESNLIRCIGVDGRIGPIVEQAQAELAAGAIGPVRPKSRLCYETTDAGRGWYVQHYNHMHISTRAVSPQESGR
jgi:hypothetical protein